MDTPTNEAEEAAARDDDADARAAELLLCFVSHAFRSGQKPKRGPWDFIGDRDPYIRLAAAGATQRLLRTELMWGKKGYPRDRDRAAESTARLIRLFADGDAHMRDGVAIALSVGDDELLSEIMEHLSRSLDADIAQSARLIQERGISSFRLRSTREIGLIAVLGDQESSS